MFPTKKFLDLFQVVVFQQRPDAKQIFDELVELGCDRNILRDGMLQISLGFALLRRQGIGKRRYLAVWDFMGLPSRREILKLRHRVLWIAREIEKLNQTRLSGYMKLLPFLVAGDTVETKLRHSQTVQQFSDLPKLLTKYATYLQRAHTEIVKNFEPKNCDAVALREAKLIDHIKDATGQFHFEKIGTLLEAAYEIAPGYNVRHESRFTGEAVRRRYQRLGYRRRRKLTD
jgi:hypothetical protein